METQFSLSVELSKVVPLVPILQLASNSALAVVRKFQSSGSNLLTEHDLAAVLGRSRIDQQFASTFRNAVKTSRIHKLAGIAELILEAGAGPTVQHAVEVVPFFAMTVQLSMLLWAHDIKSLAKCIVQALEEMPYVESQNVPRYDQLVGTLRCIREQTCGFLWELRFAPVEEILKTVLGFEDYSHDRVIPYRIFSTLLEALPSIQHFTSSVDIRTHTGISTIILWAHYIHGLTVELKSSTDSYIFGEGVPVVHIIYYDDVSSFESYEIVILNETGEVTFQASTDSTLDSLLWPSARHPIQGYGTKLFSIAPVKFKSHFCGAGEFAILTTQLALISVYENQALDANLTIECYLPSSERIFQVASILFPEYINSDMESKWQTPEQLSRIVDRGNKSLSRHENVTFMRDAILALSAVILFDDCLSVPLHLIFLQSWQISILSSSSETNRVPRYSHCFNFLGMLLSGHINNEAISKMSIASVTSGWGWSLCLSSVTTNDPSSLSQGIAFVQGVPSRSGERKSYVLDSGGGRGSRLNSAISSYTIIKSPGEEVRIQSPVGYTVETKHMIGSSEDAFHVTTAITIATSQKDSERTQDPIWFRYGYRDVQSLFWGTKSLPPCDCGGPLFKAGQTYTLPSKTWAFHGVPTEFPAPSQDEVSASSKDIDPFELRTNPPADAMTGLARKLYDAETTPDQREENRRTLEKSSPPRDPQCRVHIAMTAGSHAMKKLVLALAVQPSAQASRKVFKGWFILRADCCLDCAVKYVRSNYHGDNIRLAHVGLIT